MPENQNAGKPENKQASIPAIQNSGKLEIQHPQTPTEKVTYRFHPDGKYAIEDIKTILSRKIGIKASYELIAEEAILIAYEDLLENQHASMPANWQNGYPACQKTRNPASQNAVTLPLDINLIDATIIRRNQ